VGANAAAPEVPQKTDIPLPHDSYRWNKAILGAFKKGVASNQSGLPITACPYQDKRTPSGRLSWSRSFISAWVDGWRWGDKRRIAPQAEQSTGKDANDDCLA
jgi:hypothetical protein